MPVFNEKAKLDPSQVQDRRGAPRGAVVGGLGGGIGIIVLIVALLLGVDPFPGDAPSGGVGPSQTPAASAPGASLTENCQAGADANTQQDCRIVAYVNSIQSYWSDEFARRGSRYAPSQTVLFTDATETDCGDATSAVGPFYCPLDQDVYLDLGFFDELRARLGAQGGPFAEAYVLAHEYGHHVQNLTGQMERINRSDTGESSDAVRLELQADCYAGVWAFHATTTETESGEPLITEITRHDIDAAVDAAETVGDDYIQERMQGTVSPETWTHGSSDQRRRWFEKGLASGDPNGCDTFAPGALN